MRNTTKFGSPKLDIYNSTYDFSKLAYILEINALEFRSTAADSRGPWVSRARALVAQNRAPVLTGQSSPMASSSTMAPAPQGSPWPSARTGVSSWVDYWS